MKRFINSLFACTLAITLLVPSMTAHAAEASQEFDTITEAVAESDNITRTDIMTLEDASEVVSEQEAALDSDRENLVSGVNTYKTSCSMADFAGLGYSNDNAGPISIVKATLNEGKHDSKEVYIVGLSGTAFVKNQATGIVSDILAGFNMSNPYTTATVNAIKAYVPAGSNLIFCGHSLGGMVAQECTANSAIKDNYNVLNTVTFGSPLISAGSREGNTQRLGDKYDIIPYMSVTGAILPVWAVGGLNRENGGYGSYVNFWSAHMQSYCRTSVWGNYDVLGFKYGQNTLTYDVDTVAYFKAPTKW